MSPGLISLSCMSAFLGRGVPPPVFLFLFLPRPAPAQGPSAGRFSPAITSAPTFMLYPFASSTAHRWQYNLRYTAIQRRRSTQHCNDGTCKPPIDHPFSIYHWTHMDLDFDWGSKRVKESTEAAALTGLFCNSLRRYASPGGNHPSCVTATQSPTKCQSKTHPPSVIHLCLSIKQLVLLPSIKTSSPRLPQHDRLRCQNPTPIAVSHLTQYRQIHNIADL